MEYANLVGAQAVLGKISPAILNGGWEALDPLDRVMHAAWEGAEDPTVGSGWSVVTKPLLRHLLVPQPLPQAHSIQERLAKAQTIAM